MDDLIWEFYQHGRVVRAEAQADQAIAKTYTAEADVASLAGKLDRLALVCRAMWSLIQTRTSLTEQDLMKEMGRLDLLDGRADGKVLETAKCSRCGTVLGAKATTCYRCGASTPLHSAFHTL
jgi:hypothetical protein